MTDWLYFRISCSLAIHGKLVSLRDLEGKGVLNMMSDFKCSLNGETPEAIRHWF